MKTLLLMRHGKSSWKDKSLKDKQRPLKKRGVEDAKEIGKLLLENELVPQVILSSSALRARQTAEQVTETCKYKGKISYLDEYYMAEPEIYLEKIKSLPDEIERVLVIGHNPGLEALLQMMDGKIESLPTGSLAYLSLSLDAWANISLDTAGELVGFWLPEKEEEVKKEKNMAKDKDKGKKDKKEKKEKKGKKDKK